MMIRHRVSDRRAADAADNRANRAADQRSADSAGYAAGHRAALIREGWSRRANKRRRSGAKHQSRHQTLRCWPSVAARVRDANLLMRYQRLAGGKVPRKMGGRTFWSVHKAVGEIRPADRQCAFRTSPRRSGLKRMTTMIAAATTPAASASANA
jgi:hypothetical protein